MSTPTSPAIGKIKCSFSADPAIVTAHARAFIRGHKDHRVITTLKHFPGHGSATGDTHISITDITATYQRDVELFPYETLIQEGYRNILGKNSGTEGATMTAQALNSAGKHS